MPNPKKSRIAFAQALDCAVSSFGTAGQRIAATISESATGRVMPSGVHDIQFHWQAQETQASTTWLLAWRMGS
jgi:hypothetical protein